MSNLGGGINLNKYASAAGRRNVYSMLWPLYTQACNSAEINDAEASDDSGQRDQEEIPTPARTYPVTQPVASHFKDRRVPINSIQSTHVSNFGTVSDENGYDRHYKMPYLSLYSGPDGSVCITTVYGLDGPGSNPGEEEVFRPSRLALGPTQPPV